jgi:capsular polysaccharide transport system permease protein
MIDRLKQTRAARGISRLTAWAQGWLVPALLRRRTFGAAFVASILAALYWGVIASDRYVSEAHVIIQRTDQAGGDAGRIGSLLGSIGSSSGQSDQLLLRDHLMSVDMLARLDAKLNLRAHYSDWRRDPISRMWFKDASLEWFHRHYLSRVTVEFDDYSGILLIKAEGYDPKTAHAIASMLVEEGERFMNILGHQLAQEQVTFLEKQVEQLTRRVTQTRQIVLDFQNRHGLISPAATTQAYAGIVSRLEGHLVDLQTRRTALLGYLMADSPNIVEINMQIAAVEKQLAQEKARLTSATNNTLNRTVEEYQRLEMNAQFALDVYKVALVGLEKGRVEATRTLKKVSVLQSPFLPQYPIEPRRIYNTVVFILVALLIAGVIHLIAAIIRDHKD